MSAKRAMNRLWLLVGLLCSLPLWVQAAPAIQHWQTSNGARVYFVPAPELPMLDVRVVFDAGSARDGDQQGIARLTGTLLTAGSATFDEEQVAERFESVGAQYGTGVERDMAMVSLRSLTDTQHLQTALDTLAGLITAPAFPAAAFERERERQGVALQSQQESPGDLAEIAFYRALYGEHPYAHNPLGTPESVKALTREAVVAFHRSHYVAANAVVAIIGALERAQAEAIAEQLVGKLPKGEAVASLPEVAPLAAAKTERISYPSAQSHVFIGQPGMARHDPDYFVLYVGNHILGGSGLVSRLNDEIREKRGLSYSVYSYFMPLGRPGPFQMGVQTKTDKVHESIAIMNDTLRKFIDEGPTEAELKSAKSNITGGFPLRIDSNRKIAEYLAVIGFYGLPLDYLDTFNGKVMAVTREQIKDAFKRRIQPDRQVTVVVGESVPEAAGK